MISDMDQILYYFGNSLTWHTIFTCTLPKTKFCSIYVSFSNASCVALRFLLRYDLEEYERVTTMKNITLSSEETVSGMKGFIVVGTTYVYGEDLPCKGRVCQC